VADVLREALATLADRISAAFVYGSIAGGAERKSSDIDVMIIGTVSFEEVVRALQPCQEQLRREINPNVYSSGEFRKKVKERNSFLSHVMASPKLFILGKEDDLVKPRANRKAETT